MVKIAYVFDDGRVYVEFSPEKFRGIFLKYFGDTGSVEAALDKIEADLRRESQKAK